MPGGKYRNYGPKRHVPPAEQPLDQRRLAKHIVEEARQKAMWIFDPSKKTWYSPEEFKDAFHRFHTDFDDFFAQCQIRDLQDGFNAGLTQIQRLIDEITAFVSRIVNYYKPR